MPQSMECIRKVAAATALLVIGMALGLGHTPSAAQEQRIFNLVAVNEAPATNDVKPVLALWGNGTFTAQSVEGGGGYVYLDGATEVPKKILSSGTWRATEVAAWSPAEGGATYGTIHPSILDLTIDLMPDEGAAISGATLRINCNVGPAGIINKDPDSGEELAEGYWLTLPAGATFGPTTDVGTFAPMDPILGVTVIASQDGS